MNVQQSELLALRFAESDTEWRRLACETDLSGFLAECLGSPPPEPPPAVHLSEGETGFTLANGLILETGTLVLSGTHPTARRTAFLAEEHFALVAEETCFETLADYLGIGESDNWRTRVGHQLTLITGPSRTADIEKTLVLGAHGPRRLVIATAPAALIKARFGEAYRREPSDG